MSTTELTRLQAMHGLESRTVTQQQVALQLGLSVRQVKRLWRRFRLEAEAGLISRRRGKPSNRRTDPVLMERALELVRTLYPDFGPTLAAEKLDELHGIRIDHETLRRALVACGLRKLKRRKRLRVHPSRDRRPCRGELAQIDGSHHPWFENRAPGCTLYVDVDDATSQLLALHFGVGETTAGYFELARQHILNHGVPLAFYADKYSVFRINNVGDAAELRTQFGRAMDDLDVELICAHSPQAKGRVERATRPCKTAWSKNCDCAISRQSTELTTTSQRSSSSTIGALPYRPKANTKPIARNPLMHCSIGCFAFGTSDRFLKILPSALIIRSSKYSFPIKRDGCATLK